MSWTPERKEAASKAYADRKNRLCKTETYNGDEPTDIEAYDGMKLNHEDRLRSMINTIRVLPPNMLVGGRHIKENVQAICGFKVTDAMMDEVYKDFKHDTY